MAFKLGSRPQSIASGGNITKKHGFIKSHEDLPDGVLGESYPGKVVINSSIERDTALYNKVERHEEDHVKRMSTGEASFTDDYVEWQGERFERKDGLVFWNGEWREEGDSKLPWEAAAINAEK